MKAKYLKHYLANAVPVRRLQPPPWSSEIVCKNQQQSKQHFSKAHRNRLKQVIYRHFD
jgi:hypothetical protein